MGATELLLDSSDVLLLVKGVKMGDELMAFDVGAT